MVPLHFLWGAWLVKPAHGVPVPGIGRVARLVHGLENHGEALFLQERREPSGRLDVASFELRILELADGILSTLARSPNARGQWNGPCPAWPCGSFGADGGPCRPSWQCCRETGRRCHWHPVPAARRREADLAHEHQLLGDQPSLLRGVGYMRSMKSNQVACASLRIGRVHEPIEVLLAIEVGRCGRPRPRALRRCDNSGQTAWPPSSRNASACPEGARTN